MNLPSIQLMDVWTALGGGPLRGNRSQAFWRGGDGYSVALDAAKGAWFDHRDGRGGGILALVETARGCTRAAALTWLEGENLLEPRALTREQRTEYARRRGKASSAALDIACWQEAFTVKLNARKVSAVDAGDDQALALVASLCNMLENGSAADITRAFIRHRADNPAEVARLIAVSRERDLEAQRITAEVVLLLARVGMGDSRHAA